MKGGACLKPFYKRQFFVDFAMPPTFTFANYVLRPLQRADAEQWSSYLSDSLVTRETSWAQVDPNTIKELVCKLIGEYATGTSCRWAIARSEDNTLIGTCGFSQLSYSHGTGEMAYDLAPRFWGRAIMSQSVRAIVDWGFVGLRLNRIQAVVMKTNRPSISLLESCGFKREGLLRKYRLAHNEPRDFYMYSILPEDRCASDVHPLGFTKAD